MQLQPLQNKSSNPPFGKPINEPFVPIPRDFAKDIVPISIGSNAQFEETTDSLVSLGKRQALSLVETLTKLKARDESAIYPIIAILEPFTEITSLDLRLPPISSNKVILNVIDRGRAKSNLSLP